jgi:GTP-binding protein
MTVSQSSIFLTTREQGRTQALNFFSVQRLNGKGLISVLVDAPGYGARGRPEWGKLFDHYIRNREEWVSLLSISNIYLDTR